LRYAAIDIGSNAVRLLIADIIETSEEISFKKNTLIRVPLRLGDNAFLDKEISERKADDLVKTMLAFRNLMDVYTVQDYMACATSAMREARNGDSLVRKIKKTANIDLEIIAGQKEAHIIYSSHINEHLDHRRNYLYVDVGGGSNELSVFSEGEPEISRSFDLGTIRILDNQDKDETWTAMKEWIKQINKKYKNLVGIGTGGNINKIYRMAQEKDGMPLAFSKFKEMYAYLNSFSLKDRITILNLNQDRADVIIPACEIYLAVMKWADIKQIYVPRLGMVDGIIQLLIEKNFGV
jgi:exopolyphosphatase/guanosine-5'-triphosphate,3'-diphosphate pyrophosphatase